MTMRKNITVLIVCVMSAMFLFGCGKSEATKNVEKAIDSLSESSTIEDIGKVYNQYKALSNPERYDLKNKDTLSNYCDIESGNLPLTDEMISIIKDRFVPLERLSISHADGDIIELSKIQKSVGNMDDIDIASIDFSSDKKLDDYNYVAYGKINGKDAFGDNVTYKFTLYYGFTYDELSDGDIPNCKLSKHLEIEK